MDSLLVKYCSCSLCNDILREPKELPCHHVYCKQCLEGSQTHNQELDCKECGSKFHLQNGVASLPTNNNLEVLIGRLVAGAKAAMVAPHPECKECDENPVAISICLDCTKYLCHSCDDYHRKARRTHSVRLLKDTEKFELKTLRCAEHNKKTSLYCWTCDCLICPTCAVDLRQKHGNHWREDLGAVLPRCKEWVQLATKGAQQVAKEVSEAIGKIKRTQDALERSRLAARQRVEDGFQEALRKLNEEKERQMVELENIHDAKRKSIATQLEQCEHMEKILTSHLECSNDVGQISEAGFISIWSKVRDVLVSLKATYHLNIPPQCCEMDTIEVRAAQIPDFTDKIGEVFVAPKDKTFMLAADISKAKIIAGKEFQFTVTCTDVYATCLHYNGALPELDVQIAPLDAYRGYQAFHQGGQAGHQDVQAAHQGGHAADQDGQADGQGGQADGQGGQAADQDGQADGQDGQAADQGGQAAHLHQAAGQGDNHANQVQANLSGSANQAKGKTMCTATLSPNGSYTVKLLTCHIGLHRLTFKVAGGNDNDVMDPLDILVVPDVRATAKCVAAQIRTSVVRVKSVAIRGNLCVYTNEGNWIGNLVLGTQIFKSLQTDSDGYVYMRGDNVPVSLEGIAIDVDNSVIVADKTNRSVRVMKAKEPVLIQCLTRNDGQQFEGPTSVAVNRNGRIFVGDSTSIQYFNPNYTHAGQILNWDDKRKGAVDTLSIAVDAQDNLLVASQTLGKVYVLKEDSNHYSVVYTFGDCIIGPNRNHMSPVGIVADCRYGYIYIIEQKHLWVFSSEGECLACYDKVREATPFCNLSGISVTKEGTVIIVDGGALMEMDVLHRYV